MSSKEMERKLRLEWDARKKPPHQFTVERMQMILEKENERKMGDLDDDEEKTLGEKMSIIRRNKKNEISVGKAASTAVTVAKVGVKPPVVKKSHQKKIALAEKAERDIIDNRSGVRRQLKEHLKVEKTIVTVQRKAIALEEPTHGKAKELKVEQEVTERAKEMEEFLQRRDREQAEKDREKREKLDREEKEKNKIISEEKEKEYHNDAMEVRRLKDEEVKRQQDQALQKDNEELEAREERRRQDQSQGPKFSTHVEFPNGKQLGGKNKSEPGQTSKGGVDDHTNDLFQKAQHTDYEERRTKLMDSQSQEGQKEDLYESLKTEIKQVQTEMENTQQLRSRLSTELEQNQQEMTQLLQEQAGPPRRDPTPDERMTAHMRKERARNLAAEISKLNRKELGLDEKLSSANNQSGRVAAKLSVLRTTNKKTLADLETFDNGFLPPPMIVGRQLNKTMDPFYANPERTYAEIQAHSKLEIIREKAKPAIAAHKEARQMEQGVWFANERLQNERVQVEGLLSRLAGASDRLKHARSKNLQADLIEAIHAFFDNQCKLNVVDEHHEGPLNWWQHRDPRLTFGIDQLWSNDEAIRQDEKIRAIKEQIAAQDLDESSMEFGSADSGEMDGGDNANSGMDVARMLAMHDISEEAFNNKIPAEDINKQGVGLGKEFAGNLMGLIELPKFSVWTIELLLVKRNPEREGGQGDPADWVTVKLGTNLKNVAEVTVARNVVDEETGEILIEVKHTVRCKELAYKFEFSSSSNDHDTHFVVERGYYSQKMIEPLETVDIETGRVISDYVKQVRIEEKQGKLRSSNLITELIAAEEDEGEFWDSGALFGVFQKSGGVKTTSRTNNMPGHGTTVGKRGQAAGGNSGYSSRYPKKIFIALVKEELERLRDEAIKEEKEKGIYAVAEEDIYKEPKKRLGMSKKQQREFTLQNSKRKYIIRKREKYQTQIQDAKKLKGAHIEIFDNGTQAWEHMKVIDCVIKWVENGTKPKIDHEVSRLNGSMDTIGEPFKTDLGKERFYVSKETTFDSEAQAKWLENEKLRKARLKDEKQRLKQAEREARRRREGREKERDAFEDARDRAVEKAREHAEVEANKVAKMKATKTEIQETVKSIYHELRVGITGEAQKVSMSQARREAERRWKMQYVKERVEETEAIWLAASEQRILEEKNKEIKEAEERAKKETEGRIAMEAAQEKDRAAIRERTSNLKSQIKIKDFHKAVNKAPMCEHMRVRHWGDCYGKGLRCLDCGLELTKSESKQEMGIGSGEDIDLVNDVNAHRANESSFRFKDGAHLRRVENERARLEKERREMKLQQNVFYDFEDQMAIYEFDRRHKIYFKEKGVVRQGVQWTETELQDLKEQQLLKIQDLDPLDQIQAKRDLELFYASFRPPTFRAEGIKRQAAFHDLLTTISRINSYRQRIRELKDYRVEIVAERGSRMMQLQYLHIQVFKLEVNLRQIGQDLQDAASRLQIREDTRITWQKVIEILKVAEHDKKMTDLARVGVEGNAEEAEDVVRDLADQVRAILRHRMKEERKTRALEERAKRARTKADELKETLKETQNMIDLMHYRVRGQLIPTRFGARRVLFYRELDKMLCVDFPVGGTTEEPAMKARLYVPIHESMDLERGWQQSNIVAMEREDNYCKAYYKKERQMMLDEQYQIAMEDRAMRELDELRRGLAREETLLYDNVVLAVSNARQFVKTRDGKKEIRKRVEEALVREERNRHLAVLQWTGIGKKPRPLKDYERVLFRMRMKRPLRKAFIVEMAKQSESETLSALSAERAKKATAQTFEFVMNEYIKEFMADLAGETIDAGMNSKDRAEANTGIVFAQPPHMQYDIYCVLRKWWMTKKADLKKMLETWGVRSAQDAERLEQAKREQAELEMDIERREKEAEERNDLCLLMAKEEAFSRRFYREELKQTLGERRLMVAEEQHMKIFMKEEQIEKEAAASKYNVYESSEDTGPSAKEKRRAELKKSGAERNRIKKEVELMKYEDELAGALRAAEKKAEQIEQLKAEMDLWGGAEDLDDLDDDDAEINSDISSEVSDDSQEAEEDKVARAKEEEVRKSLLTTDEEVAEDRGRRKKERLKRRRGKAKRRAEARREAAERRAAEEWERALQEAMVKHASREMEWMEEEEEAKEVEKELFTHQTNCNKLKLYGQSKGKEELRMKAVARKKREHSDQCVEANDKAETWRKRCKYVETKRHKNYEHMVEQTLFMDTDAITKFHQRWETNKLHHKLHNLYFRTLAIIIANKAEIVAGERRMMRVQELLLSNQVDTDTKVKNMEDLWRNHNRESLMRLYRSGLGQKIFQKSRKKMLTLVFQGWVRYWLWHKGHKEAFELKFTMIKQELDLKRLYPETRDELERREYGVTKNGKDKVPTVRKTILQKHKARPIHCRYCQEFYIEEHNNNVACAYHPGEYRVSCPKTCPGFSDPKMVTTKCMSHRCKRWTCCDVREEGLFGRNGCEMRSHMPPPNGDPDYSEKVRVINKADKEVLDKLDLDLEAVRGQNHILEAFKIKSDQLKEISDSLIEERKVVKRYEKLKFV
ncbi:hypothetical protein TL16_g06397 [Triparma laevis f. inornata]|uniref:Uncharacterized protein n=1 Tax=Triparma laevis f. inornata TaxID=1714386 RepID=A0A9W7EF41_9STRA|nr:hypothetical protein TL16_g06397 [Triparma laevis f. inornata]